MKINQFIDTVELTGLAWTMTGCETAMNYRLTCRLWPNGDPRKWNEQSPDWKLVHCEATQRAVVLVQHDAIGEEPEARLGLYSSNLLHREIQLEDGLFWKTPPRIDSTNDQNGRTSS